MSLVPQLAARADKRLYEPALDEPASARSYRCSTATLSSPAGDIVVLRVAGEVDSGGLVELDAALDDVLDRRPDHLVVDLTGLVSCSSGGLATIARAARTAVANGTHHSMSGASLTIARRWPHYWAGGAAPPIHRTTSAAVLAAIVLQADSWNPLPPAASGRAHPVVDGRYPDGRAVGLRDDVPDADPPGPAGGRQPRPDSSDAGPVAVREALHRHRTAVYRSALHALGASYGTHPLAPDLAAQLRMALTGFAATAPDDRGSGDAALEQEGEGGHEHPG